jgi:hypothetical protein
MDGYAPQMTRLIPVAGVIVALFLIGCGGDDDDAGGDAPTKQAFVQNANQICREAEKDLERLGEGADSPEQLAKSLDEGVDKITAAADELVDLERPDGADGETATKFVEGFRQELDDKLIPAIEDLKQAVEDKDPQGVQEAAQKLEQLEASESDKFARELGASACVG